MATPKLRFKEFDGGWTKSTIQFFMDNNFILDQMDGNHGELYPKSEEFSATGVPYISATDFSFGDVNFATCKRLPIERAKLFKKGIAKNGDVLFAHNATVGPVAILKTDLDFVILSTTATYYRCEATYLNNHYLKNYFESDFFVQQYFGIMSQSTRNQVPITTQRKLNIAVPNIQEQTKIASFLSNVDEKISQLTQKHALLSQYKQGMMQKLFSQQIRFKADDGSEFGEWENLKIFDLAIDKTLNNGVFNDQNKVGKGYKLINVLDMYINRDIDESRLKLLDLSTKDFEKNKVYYGDIFFTRSSLVKEGIAFSNVYLGNSNDVTYDGHLIKLSPNLNRVNPIFLNYILKTHVVRKQLIKGGKTATMTTIGQQEVGNTIVSLPCLEEQTKIANFLSSIDQKIEVVAQQIEQAKQWKKGLLQQMFV